MAPSVYGARPARARTARARRAHFGPSKEFLYEQTRPLCGGRNLRAYPDLLRCVELPPSSSPNPSCVNTWERPDVESPTSNLHKEEPPVARPSEHRIT